MGKTILKISKFNVNDLKNGDIFYSLREDKKYKIKEINKGSFTFADKNEVELKFDTEDLSLIYDEYTTIDECFILIREVEIWVKK